MKIVKSLTVRIRSLIGEDSERDWKKLLDKLEQETKNHDFDPEESRELYLSLLAQIVEENEKGLEMLANEEVAKRSREGEDTSLDKSSSVSIKTIKT